jgi:hypothetical protein
VHVSEVRSKTYSDRLMKELVVDSRLQARVSMVNYTVHRLGRCAAMYRFNYNNWSLEWKSWWGDWHKRESVSFWGESNKR